MFRKLEEKDAKVYLEMVDEFYHSDAVLAPVPKQYMEDTFKELLRSEAYLLCYIFEYEGEPAGYALLSKSFSPEAGGIVYWVEEIYIREAYRSKGLGSAFFKFFTENPPEGTKRIRLEVEPENERAVKLYTRFGFKPLPYDQMVLDY